ncbi:helix-turn-helix domain-containing protein, partial [Lentilactobacillus kefiri]|uniref:helix-turn-helix domain-containing protein n=1 Tax=Lentilactobacillus kefiri TaxID=33962 RepID=UPI0034D44CC9
MKNAQVVMDAFEGQDRSVTEISRLTGLTARQVRYVLHALMREGYVEMDAS